MHGGGWTNGYKELMAFMAPALNRAGITFVSVGYRLAPEFTFPTGWLDAANAMRWISLNAPRIGGDPKRLFVGGHSAGGHYAALLAVRRDCLATLELPQDFIRGCLAISGIYNFTEDSGLSMRPRFLGPVEERNERAASPMCHLDSELPPMLLAHGTEDFPHLMTQAKEMERRVREAGGAVERVELPGCSHLGAAYCAGLPKGAWLPKAIDFMTSAVR
jgi:arylformamidase